MFNSKLFKISLLCIFILNSANLSYTFSHYNCISDELNTHHRCNCCEKLPDSCCDRLPANNCSEESNCCEIHQASEYEYDLLPLNNATTNYSPKILSHNCRMVINIISVADCNSSEYRYPLIYLFLSTFRI
jgi:hypothetical protein